VIQTTPVNNPNFANQHSAVSLDDTDIPNTLQRLARSIPASLSSKPYSLTAITVHPRLTICSPNRSNALFHQLALGKTFAYHLHQRSSCSLLRNPSNTVRCAVNFRYLLQDRAYWRLSVGAESEVEAALARAPTPNFIANTRLVALRRWHAYLVLVYCVSKRTSQRQRYCSRRSLSERQSRTDRLLALVQARWRKCEFRSRERSPSQAKSIPSAEAAIPSLHSRALKRANNDHPEQNSQ
jgi:hypothetical protein